MQLTIFGFMHQCKCVAILVCLVLAHARPVRAQEMAAVEAFFRSLQDKQVRFLGAADSAVADYRSVEQIVLMRHGKPDIDRKSWLKRTAFEAYIEAYDTVKVRPYSTNPFDADTLLERVYTSRLQRAIHSARLVFGDGVKHIPDARFNEFQRKAMSLPNIKLPFGFWSGFGRFLWMLGFNDGGIESFSEARFRAYYNALYLESMAALHSRCVLVGHGFMNRTIARHLKRRGWKVINLDGKAYFGCYIAFRPRQE